MVNRNSNVGGVHLPGNHLDHLDVYGQFELRLAGDLRDGLHLPGDHLDLGQRRPLPPQLLHLLTALRQTSTFLI